MINLDTSRVPTVSFLGGSSTLILGSESLAASFLNQTVYASSVNRNLRWICPETILYRTMPFKSGSKYHFEQKIDDPFLYCPREIFYQTLGKKICWGGDIVFVRGITGELVDKFDNQNTDGYKEKCEKAFEEFLRDNSDAIIEHEQYEDEYPPLDAFGNLNHISWLREYAMHADNFSKEQCVDVFLSLEWNKSKSDFPSTFWKIFDRIYKFEKTGKNSVAAVQLR